MKLLRLLLFLLPIGFVSAQQTNQCPLSSSASSTGASTAFNNALKGCYNWRFTYVSTGFSALSIQVEGSPDGTTWTALTAATGTGEGTNPSTVTTFATTSFHVNPTFIRVNVTAVTGSGLINWQMYGTAGAAPSSVGTSGGGGGGGGGGVVTQPWTVGTGGVTAGQLLCVSRSGSPATAITCPISVIGALQVNASTIGIAQATVSAGGTVNVIVQGPATCRFDDTTAVVAGHTVNFSLRTAGFCQDSGAFASQFGTPVIGTASVSGSASTTQAIFVNGPGLVGSMIPTQPPLACAAGTFPNQENWICKIANTTSVMRTAGGFATGTVLPIATGQFVPGNAVTTDATTNSFIDSGVPVGTPVTFPTSAPILATNSSAAPIAATTTGSGTTAVLNNSPTILTPTIADFTNANHSHQNAAGGGQVTEAALNLSNVTTNDVTISRHGFTPTLPNDATKFLNGTGTYSVPPGGGGTGGGVVTYSGPPLSILSGTSFCPIGGGGACSATETNIDIDSSAAATITNLYVQFSQALGAGNSVVVTWRKNATSQPSTCTVSGAVATSCNDTTHSFNVATGDLLDYQLAFSGTIIVTPTITIMSALGTSNVGVTSVFGNTGPTVGATGDINATGRVTGINSVPLCTGFTPTNGQNLQYTTASSPNPCYTATAGASGGSNITFGSFGSLPGTCAHSASASDAYWTTDSYYQFLCTATNTWSPFLDGKQGTLPASASNWTVVNGSSGTAAITDSKGAVSLSTATSVLGIEGAFKAIPAAPYTKTMAVRFKGSNGGSGFTFCGVAWTNGTSTSSSIQVSRIYTTPTISSVNLTLATTQWSSFAYAGGLDNNTYANSFYNPTATIWFRLADDNTNRTIALSEDGVNFTQYYSVARTSPFTPTNYGFFCAVQTNGAGSGAPWQITLLSDN